MFYLTHRFLNDLRSLKKVEKTLMTIKNPLRKLEENILQNALGMKEVCAVVVLKILIPKQKENQMNYCSEALESTQNDPDSLQRVIRPTDFLRFKRI
ncbi:hypothetical protein C0J52_12854 [Blattella germanica]|nr:hypothetical protein C0J52_12854 [Blattella germanica]